MKKAMKELITNDVLIRALKTFVQASVAVWIANGQQLTKSALVGAIAGGISAVWNFVKTTM